MGLDVRKYVFTRLNSTLKYDRSKQYLNFEDYYHGGNYATRSILGAEWVVESDEQEEGENYAVELRTAHGIRGERRGGWALGTTSGELNVRAEDCGAQERRRVQVEGTKST